MDVLNNDCKSLIFKQIDDFQTHINLSKTNKCFNKISYLWIHNIPNNIWRQLITNSKFVAIIKNIRDFFNPVLTPHSNNFIKRLYRSN